MRVSDSISGASLYEDLAYSGAVIYRDFADSLSDFNEFVSAHSSRVTFDPARKAATANTAEIEAGIHEMGLHRENGNLPFNPDLQWFYCLEAADVGSQTTLCDGQRVLFDLSAKTRKLFEQREIRYSRRIPWQNVKRFLSIELQLPLEAITDEHLQQVNDQVAGQTYRREMARLEHRLADFARVRQIRVIEDIAQFREQFYTVTGRPRRAEIEARFIDQMYA
ncbi:TauD/TfdA family dioxygenase [Pseudomonas sp. Marseille-QA0332]